MEKKGETDVRTDIEINAEGTLLRGWYYRPDSKTNDVPAVVMAHGLSAVKEMDLDRFAEQFAAAGLAVVVFDHRNFGASEGQPRQEIDPWAQVRDYRHAITWTQAQPEINPRRIGIWGSSYSGGEVLVVGAIDRRVKCVVCQVPLISGFQNIQRLVRADALASLRTQFDYDRETRFGGGSPVMIPVVTANPTTPAALPTADAYKWFTQTAENRAPTWRNEVTLRTVEMLTEFEAGSYIARISPTPLLMIIGASDHLVVADLAFSAFNAALEPKRLVILPGGNFAPYYGSFEQASHSARDWFVEHLTTERSKESMSKETDNKAVVGRWFTEFWGENCNLAVVDDLAAPDMLMKYSLHPPRRGRDAIKAFMTDFRAAFPDLKFWGTADLIAEGDYVVGQWAGGGTHTGAAFSDFLGVGSLPAATGRKMHFTGTTVLRLQNGKIVEEIGLDDGVTALTQLGLLKAG